MEIYHITPENDIKDHEQSSLCECDPEVQKINNSALVIHNSFDGREAVEWANEILRIKKPL